ASGERATSGSKQEAHQMSDPRPTAPMPPPRNQHAARRSRVVGAITSTLILLGGVTAAAMVTTQSASATTVPGPPAGWTTVFSDGFAGAAGSPVNSANWKYDTGPGSSFGTG